MYRSANERRCTRARDHVTPQSDAKGEKIKSKKDKYIKQKREHREEKQMRRKASRGTQRDREMETAIHC